MIRVSSSRSVGYAAPLEIKWILADLFKSEKRLGNYFGRMPSLSSLKIRHANILAMVTCGAASMPCNASDFIRLDKRKMMFATPIDMVVLGGAFKLDGKNENKGSRAHK